MIPLLLWKVRQQLSPIRTEDLKFFQFRRKISQNFSNFEGKYSRISYFLEQKHLKFFLILEKIYLKFP
jgi:hypothetical protein